MAEGVMNKLIRQRNLEDLITCDSAGTASYHIGSLPDKRTIQVCLHNGIKLNHRARAFVPEDMYLFDYIIVMDDANLRSVQQYASDKSQNIVCKMRDYDTAEKGGDVPDPYYDGIKEFENVYEILERSCNKLLNEMVKTCIK
jgi:protein-tyrosine phosphatase